MGATLTVLLARTFYVLLIIVGASLLELPFPFTPRQNSVLALVTVGVPILVLALWVKPVPSRRGLLVQTLRTRSRCRWASRRWPCRCTRPRSRTARRTRSPGRCSRRSRRSWASVLLSLIPVAADEEGRVRMPAWMRTAILVGAMTLLFLRRARDGRRPLVLPARAAAVGDRGDAGRASPALWTGDRAADPPHADRPARDRLRDRPVGNGMRSSRSASGTT